MTEEKKLLNEAWRQLEKGVVHYHGHPVGTVAALRPGVDILNYDHVFTRDFFVSGLAFLLNGEFEITRNFLSTTAELQSMDKSMDCFKAGEGLMPASFKIEGKGRDENLLADFGEHAIGRVTPVDSSLWWLLLLRVYVKASGDEAFVTQPAMQQAIAAILDFYLVGHFELVPTLLVPDGAFMIDRRMGMYGHPLDIEVLFYAALRSACEILALAPSETNKAYISKVEQRLGHLTRHIHANYWLDEERLETICTYKQEEFGIEVANKYNIYPESVPKWVRPWVGDSGGYFAGNIGPGRIDFRFLTFGNLFAIISSLADASQQRRILALLENQYHTLIAKMPMKACYPALEGTEWQLFTGADQKNMPWSYHNGGSWPFLLWLLAAVSVKSGGKLLDKSALLQFGSILRANDWPEYFDGREGTAVGRQARSFQAWTYAGFLTAHALLTNPQKAALFSFDDKQFSVDCPTP